MRIRSSLRLRVTIGIALLTVLSLGAHSLLLFSATEDLEEDLVNRIVTEELQYFITRHRRDPMASPPALENLTGYLATGTAARSRLPPYLRDLPAGLHEVFVDGAEHHVAVRDEPEGRFILAYNVAHHEAREQGLLMFLFLGIGVAVLSSAALSYWAAGLLVRPVRELAQHVERLGPDRPATPLAQKYTDEEVQRLARAFDGYLQKVAELIQREQEFTANVSHELRTAITTIRTSCELLLQESGLSDSARERIETIDRAAEHLTETARSLLFLARGGEGARLEEVSVHECVVEAAEPILPTLARKGIAFETAIEASAMVRADRTALFLVADNLLRNAAYYTERGRVRAVYRDGCLTIEDSGPGIDPTALPRVGERFYRGGSPAGNDGTGIGLAIVKRICERFGWQLKIDSAPGAGTRVSVYFPLPSSQELHAISTFS